MATVQTTQERRIELDSKLRALLGNTNVYFQPPESVKLKYDCIIYDLAGARSLHADNLHYKNMRRYDILHIHRDPDVDLMESMGDAFRFVSFDRRYVSENLYHDVYTLYY